MKVLIVGHGYVGKAYAGLFARRHQIYVHDPAQGSEVPLKLQEQADLAVIAVPTPPGLEGACDTTIVERAIGALPRSIPLVLIKSTVQPGTTERLAAKFDGAPLVFSPEYIGEGGYHVPAPYPDPHDPVGHGWVVLGYAPGQMRAAGAIADILLPIMGPTTSIRVMTSIEAELVKYFENSWLATKVTYANEMRRICEALGASYHAVREGWLDDPRVGRSHSAAFPARPGFDGKCLPKDTSALQAFCRVMEIPTPLLDAVIAANGEKS